VTSLTLIEKCGLIAQPVAGNPTHFLVEQAFAQAGLDWRFMSFEVEPDQLGDAIRGVRALGFRGVKIAEPHQQAVLEFLDDLTDRARMCGSVNCVTSDGSRLLGDNTEGLALVDLVREHFDLAGVRAMVLGSGRLARAMATALAQCGAASLAVASRSPDSGRQLVALLQENTPTEITWAEFSAGNVLPVAADVSLLVNATSHSASQPEQPLPLEFAAPPSAAIAVDVAYNTPESWFCREAAKRGYRVIDGVALYVEQTALAYKSWTGAAPDTAAMREATEEFLGL
jgi:shikimate dehydrogenase